MKLLLDDLKENFMLVIMKKNDFKNLDANTDNVFASLGGSRIWSKEKTKHPMDSMLSSQQPFPKKATVFLLFL